VNKKRENAFVIAFSLFLCFYSKNGRFRRRWLFVEKINVLDYNNIKIKHSNYALKER
jgi:hypothetical protein